MIENHATEKREKRWQEMKLQKKTPVCMYECYISKSLSKLISRRESFRWLSERENMREREMQTNEKGIAHASSIVPNANTVHTHAHTHIV